jgi:adenylate cyclase
VDLQRERLKFFLERIQRGIARRVHDRRVQNRLQVGSAVALGVGLLISATLFSGLFDSLQRPLSDFLYQPRAPTGSVVIVAMDDASLREIGALPWSRATLADLISVTAQAQPKVIALDLVLPEPSNEDPALAQAFQRAPRIIQPVIGVDATRMPARPGAFLRFDAALAPAPALQTSNALLAHTMIIPDADGVVRRIPVAIEVNKRYYAALGIAALGEYQNRTLGSQIENSQVPFGSLRLPVDEHGQVRLNFISPNALRVLSAVDVLRGRADPAWLRDKIVLIGVMNSGAPGDFKTPLALGTSRAYAVEIQADLIETILGAHLLVEQDRLTEIVMIFLVALLAGATLPHFRFLSAVALTILYFLIYLGYAFQKFNDGIVTQPLYPALALFLTFAGTTTFRYFSVERPRALVSRLFRRYVAPDAVDRVLHVFDNGALPLRGTRRDVSVLYVDLRELAMQVETLAPEDLVSLLNQYVALIVTIIFQHGGSVAKQTGDTILATWNLLLDQSDHARGAVRAAIEIRRAARELTKQQSREAAIEVGLGVSTGHVVAGHIGAAPRAEYAIIGTHITLAERMALKPDRGVYIDATTREHIGNEFETREVNPVRLRRKTDPQQVWKVIEPMELEEPTAEEVESAQEES